MDIFQRNLQSWGQFGIPTTLTIKASHESQDLWAAKFTMIRQEITNLATEPLLARRVIDAFDRVGFMELSITDVLSKKQIRTSQEDWQQQFMDMAASNDLSRRVDLFPDTNFVKRRYASGLLRRLGAKKFGDLHFRLPNLVILEIEARYNREKIKSNNEKCEKQQRTDASIRLKEELIGTQELMFLREKQAGTMDTGMEGLLPKFFDDAGKGFADVYIRSEIRQGTKMSTGERKFLTCDLMSALSAVAEGLPTLYFARVPLGKITFSSPYMGDLSNMPKSNFEQIADLILDTTFAFGEITLSMYSEGKYDTISLKGNWEGWSIENLLNNRVLGER
jgi:hypothetical protein